MCTVWIDVKLRLYIIWYYIYGRGQRDLQLWPLPSKLHTGRSGKRTCFVVPPLGAFKTQLGGTYLYFIAVVLYCHCLLWSYVYIYNLHRRLIRFPSNLHVTGFSSCRITQMIHSNLVCVCVKASVCKSPCVWKCVCVKEKHVCVYRLNRR